jgi:hypothetical protein
VAATYNWRRGVVSIYMNGVLSLSCTGELTNPLGFGASITNAFIGRQQDGGAPFINGLYTLTRALPPKGPVGCDA